MEPDEDPETEELEDGDLSPLEMEMTRYHEILVAAEKAGFTSKQGMRLVMEIMLRG